MAHIHEGKLVRIRPIHKEELSIYSQWRQDSEALGGFGAPALALSAEESKRFDESQWTTPMTTRLAIESLDEDRLVGWVGYAKDHPLYESMARTEEGNQPARRSLEKCGMQFEGVARHLFFDMGRWVNMAVYSILRPEWESLPLYEEYRRPFTDPWC